jgi:SAM-dependent methyltransferase
MQHAEWRFEERDCPICAGSRATAIPLGRRGGAAHQLALGCETGIVRCRGCHGVYPCPMPLPVGNPYLDHSPEAYFAGHDSTGKVDAGEKLARRAERILGTRGRLLEIGCGRGELLRGAANAGWDVRGVEMTETFARIAEDEFGVPVEVSPAETASALREQWDVVILAAVLEHVYDPMALLSRVHAGLRRGGVVFIDVPNECSFYSRMGNLYLRLTGKDWAINLSPTFPPFHVVGFCPASLKWALGRTGFYPVHFDLYKMDGCLPRRDGAMKARIENAGLRLSLVLGQGLGMGAGITCWARTT